MNASTLFTAAVCSTAIFLAACAAQSERPDLAAIAAPDNAAVAAPAAAQSYKWPRSYTLDDTTLRVFQPQVEQWTGNQLAFRVAADASTPGASGGKTQQFGVFWGTARTEVNKEQRSVTLSDITITRSNFPGLEDNGARYLKGLQQQYAGSSNVIALELLQTSLAVSESAQSEGIAVRNVPPAIIVSHSPAILIPIGGKPVIRDIPDTSFERVLNTRALIMRSNNGSTWYLHVYDGWLQSKAVAGPWTLATQPPEGMDGVAKKLADEHRADLMDGGAGKVKPTLAKGVPIVYVRDSAAELIVFRGQPEFQPIAGTDLLWAANTSADIIREKESKASYALISGRWYRTANLDAGPWSYVANDELPAGFKRIPSDSPAAVVLSAVAGTPQAKEAVIANSIPQTATIPLHDGPVFNPEIDGKPEWKPIEGTTLQYVVNSETPILKVSDGSLYALSAGVWFTATSLDVQWRIATSVRAALYDIPPSSALYYTTFVHIYGATDDVVYVGYTPGYLGTVVNADGVVVYGTGYDYTPWVGTSYYAAPTTYGTQAQPVNNPSSGSAYTYGLGLTTASMVYGWGYPVYYTPYYYGYPCCGSTSANVYGHYGDTSFSGTSTYYSKSSGEVGVKSSGTYDNSRTGTTGTYSTNRYTNPYQGQAGRSVDRSIDGADGGSGNVSRDETYNANKNQTTYSASSSGTTAAGNSVSRDSSASWGAQGDSSSHQTTVTNSEGESKTFSSGSEDADHYASANGENYRNTGSGWQKQTDSGWEDVSREDSDWANNAQQARSQGQARASTFSEGAGTFGSGDRSGNVGGDFGGGQRSGDFGGGEQGFGGGDRAGGLGGGGFGSHFGGGGFGGRFGGGGFGGGFHGGGFRGRR